MAGRLADAARGARALDQVLRRRACARPDEIVYTFLIDGEQRAETLTYGELDRRARAVAVLLAERGAAGQQVLLLYPPGLAYAAALLGCLYAGAVALPAYPPRINRSLPRLLAIVADAQPRLALSTGRIFERAAAWRAQAPQLAALGWLATDELPESLAADWREPGSRAPNLAILQYTSGSTGTPKGVMLGHANLLANLAAMRRRYALTADSRAVSWLPPYHDMGLIGGLLQPLYSGFPVTLMSPFAFLQRPLRWLWAISRSRATVSAAPNFAYDLCVRRSQPEQRAGLDLSSWRVAINGAEPVRAETLARFTAAFAPHGFRAEAATASYGLAEATLLVASGRSAAAPVVRQVAAAALARHRVAPPVAGAARCTLVGCGAPLPGHAVRIVEPHSGAPCRPGRVGEIWIGGPSVAQGYWNRPEESATVFAATLAGDGGRRFLRTGDLGFVASGELFVTGRLKDLVILHGRNLYPQDIELTAERSDPALQPGAGAAFAVDVGGEERLVVVYEVERGGGAVLGRIAEAVRRAVAEEHAARVYELVLVRTATIPKTTSGKIRRAACREGYLAGTLEVVGRSLSPEATAADVAAPLVELSGDDLLALPRAERAGALCAYLAEQVARSLGRSACDLDPQVGLTALGLDSVAAAELQGRVEEELGLRLGLAGLLSGASIAQLAGELAARLDSAAPVAAPPEAVAAESAEHPLSHGQEALWLFTQLAPQSAVHNLAAAARRRGPLDTAALGCALDALAARHAALRTTFSARGGRAVQRVQPTMKIELRRHEAAGWSAAALESRLRAEARRPFDLDTGPPLRVHLFARTGGETVLLLAIHHLVADFRSIGVLLGELGALYAAAQRGEPADLPPPPGDLLDYGRRQRQLLAGPAGERLWQAWQSELAGGLSDLELPTDRPRPAARTYAGAARRLRLDRGMTAALGRLARTQGTTLYLTLLAGFQALLARHSGQEDFCVGAPVSLHGAPGLAATVGYLVNLLPLRAELQGDPSFAEVLARLRARALAAFAHDEFPFPLLADRLRPQRDPSRPPLCQALCVLHRAQAPHGEAAAALAVQEPGVAFRLGPLELETLTLDAQGAEFDVSLAAAELGGGLSARLCYNADLFDAPTAERLLGHLAALLGSAAGDPARRLSELSLLSPAERHHLCHELNDTAAGYPPGGCLHELVEAQAARTPAAVAVEYAGRQLSYAELNAAANLLAGRLLARGVGPEVAVGVCLERSLELVVALLAVLKAGGAYLPLSPGDPPARLAQMLAGSGAPLVVAARRFERSLAGHVPAVLWLDEAPAPPAAHAPPNPVSGVGPGNAAYLLYTSGSSGLPKGVVNTHGAICNRLLWMQEAYRLGAADRVLQKTPFTFDVSVWEFFGPLASGARLVLARPEGHRDAAYLAELIGAAGVTTAHFVPSMLRPFLAQPGLAACGCLERVMASGEALPAELERRFFARLGAVLLNLYGPTEAAVEVTSWRCRRGEPRPAVPIGRPIANLAVYLLDRQGGLVPHGVTGELHIGGAGLARGYLGRPELTAERFVPDRLSGRPGSRLYRTGDLARHRPDGAIEYLGRLDDQVKVRGVRIELGEIEAALRAHDAVGEAAVLVREDAAGERRLVAWVAPVRDRRPAAAELRRFLGERLPETMVPAAFHWLEELPSTPHGKVDRRALAALERSMPAAEEAPFVVPRSAAERLLAAIWGEVLGRERVGVEDNFFALGGDSILLLQVVARCQQAGLRLLPQQLFEHQTIAELAGMAEAAAPGEAPRRRAGPAPLAPAQHWFFARGLPDQHHFNQAVLLVTGPGTRADLLAAALARVIARHDALRHRFRRVAEGWLQEAAGPPPEWPVPQLDLSQLTPAARERARAAAAAGLQASLDLEGGPLLRAALFTSAPGGPGRLLVVIHHLVVDAVSWRVLLADLEAVYLALERGRPAALAPPTTPFGDWAERLNAAAHAGAFDRHLPLWLQPAASPAAQLPAAARPREPDPESAAEATGFTLTAAETRRLLGQATRLRARVDELLLAALAVALRPIAQGAALRVDLEAHGRETALAGVDLSGTVGWCTAIFPAWLELPPGTSAADAAAALRRVKERLRPLAAHGATFGALRYLSPAADIRARLAALPPAEVLFNYLGQLDTVLAGSRLLQPAAEPVGASRSGRASRSHRLELEARISAGKLRVELRYGRRRESRDMVERLASGCRTALGQLLALERDQAGWCVGDFPLAALDPARLAEVLAGAGPIDDIYPLSSTQEGLLFHTLYEPEAGVYVSQLDCELAGELDRTAFRRTWEELLARHAVLRTSFCYRGGRAGARPVQRVHGLLSPPLLELDWTELPGAVQRRELAALLRRDRERGFVPEAAPLLRLYLVRLDARRHGLVWSHHHLLLDGWSVALLLEELFELYGSFRRGDPARLPRPRPFRDYIAWLEAQDLAAAESFWRSTLAGLPAPPSLPLPADRGGLASGAPAAGAARRGGVRERRRELTAAETDRLRQLARRHRVTLGVLLQAAWSVLLARYSGEPEVVFGVTFAGRPALLAGVEAMVGLFVNTLPLRVRVDAGERLASWLADLHGANLAVRRHEHSPLVKVAGWAGRPAARLFDTIVVFENYPREAALRALASGASGLAVTEVRNHEQTNYPLALVGMPGEGLGLRLNHDPRFCDEPTAERMLTHAATLLCAIAAHTDELLGRLPMLAAAERHQLVHEWAAGPTGGAPPSLVELYEAWAAVGPHASALAFGDEHMSYGELNSRANRLAHYLRRRGAGPERLVGLCVERGVQQVVGLLGILKAGAAYLPLDPAYPGERLALMLADSGCRLVVSGRPDLPAVPAGVAQVCLAAEEPAIARQSADDPGDEAWPDGLAYVLYTSGSTGRPKGVLITHRGLGNLAAEQARRFALGPGSRILQFAPASFDAAISEVAMAARAGALLVLAAQEEILPGPALLRLLAARQISAVTLPPSALAALPPGALPALRTLVVAGESCPPELADRWAAGRRLIDAYGPTEATVCATAGQHLAGSRIVSLGRPLADVQTHLLDAGFEPAPAGVPAELCIGGVGLARGYLGRPELTAASFVPDPFAVGAEQAGGRLYRSGDLARRLPDGRLEFLGRIDLQVKVRGVRVEPGEIEAALCRQPGVREALVVARGAAGARAPVELAARGPALRLIAYLVPEPGAELDAGELLRALAASLPAPWVPDRAVVLEALPLLPSGKIDRRALPEPAPRPSVPPAAGAAAAAGAPSSPGEEILAGIWAEVLGLPAAGREDDFFALGGHSLLAGRVLARVHAVFGVELPLRSLFESRTPAALARVVAAAGRPRPAAPPPLAPLARGGDLPASFAQERLWFLDRLEPGSDAYNVPGALRLEGGLAIPALERALEGVVHRHEALRTTLVERRGVPVQVVAPPGRLALPVVDLSRLPGREGEAARLALAEARRPFALGCGPLLRLRLLVLGSGRHVLLFTVHHAVSDEASTALLLHELSAFYGAAVSGRSAGLPALPVQYAEFAAWQRAMLSGEALAAELSYWRERLRGASSTVTLPADRARPPIKRPRGGIRRRALGRGLAAPLERLSRTAGATLFMTLLAAFQALLHRYGGEEDLCVGTPVAGRGRLELEGVVGLFVNTLVIRGEVSGGLPFGDLVARLRERVLEAHAHQALPFERLVAELAPRRDLSREPLFEVLFVYHPQPLPLPRLPGVAVERLEVERGIARFDWTLTVERSAEGLAAACEYSSDLFDPTTVDRALRHYEALLRAAAAAPATLLGELPLLAEAERHQLLVAWNDTGLALPEGGSVLSAIAAQAGRRPHACAVSGAGETLSYGGLARRAGELARLLARLGVAPEVPVAVCLERSPAMVTALLGVLRAGGAYVPLDPALPRERMAAMLADARPAVLLTERSLARALPGGAARVVTIDCFDAVAEAAAAPALPAGPVSAASLAYVIYTSGSTGQPKGVGIVHGALANFLAGMQGELALTAADRLLAVTSLSFDIAGLELFLPLTVGAAVEICSREDAADGPRLRALLAGHGITALQATPATWRLLLDAGWRGGGTCKVLCGGEALAPELAARLTGAAESCWNLYGPTETTIWSAGARLEGGGGRVTLGRPLANTGIVLLDRSLQPAPVGVPAALSIAGQGLARGYHNRPDLTAEKFLPHPFAAEPGERLYATGDLARRLPDGELEFLGRLDHQVKVRGFRVELGEVEAVLATHPGVRQAVVTAPGGERLVAYVVPRTAPGPSVQELGELLRRRLPDYEVPGFFVVLDHLPLTPNGKVDRRALPAPLGLRPDLAWRAPRTPAEEVLAGLWADLLGLDRVGIDDSFFDLGGHSLLATRLLARMREVLGCDLPVRQLFATPTVAGLAALLARGEAGGQPGPALPPLLAGARPGELPPSSGQQRLWFFDQMDPGSPLYNLATAVRIDGVLGPAVLRRALDEVVRRHESLRTTFPAAEGGPRQVIAPVLRVVVPLVDLGAAGAAAEREARRLASAAARRPFDLARGPLLRALLLRTGGKTHWLILTLHHIVTDGWSNQLLVGELAALCRGLVEGGAAALPAPAAQFADYALWERQWLAGEGAATQLAYWRRQLAAVPALDLPTDRPRPALAGRRGGVATVTLDRRLGQAVRAAGRAQGTTTFMTALAAFAAVLWRYSRQDEFAVGTPVANRRLAETAGVVGLFANSLALRLDLSGPPSFAGLLARVRDTALAAYERQELPFERLVEALPLARDLSRPPLFQVLFAVDAAPPAALCLPGLRLLQQPVDTGACRFDLELVASEREGALASAALLFSRDLYDATTAARLLHHLANLLAGGCADPAASLGALPLLGRAERHQLLVEWPTAAGGAEGAEPAHRRFTRQAAVRPAAVALVAGESRLTYGELERRANRLAARLLRLGAGPEVRVALHLGRSAELVVGLLAVLKAGAAYVPVEPTLPAARRDFLLADCAAAILVTDAAPRELPPFSGAIVDLGAERRTLAREDAADPAVEVRPGDLAYLLYTSGSSGDPKAVLVEHGSLTNVLAASRRRFGWEPADAMPCLAPFSFDIFLFELLNPLLAGGTCELVELVPALDLERLIASLDRFTHLHAVPSLMRQLVDAALAQGGEAARRRRLRTLFVGGEAVPAGLLADLRRAFPQATIEVLYGPTEATVICASHRLRPDAAELLPLLGEALPGLALRLYDGEGNAVPCGVPGEIWVAGAGVGRGYWNRPELTARQFVEIDGQRCFRTGDLARRRADGGLEFLGRADRQVKVRGFRIEPAEVEAALAAHPQVRQAVVVAHDFAPGDRRLVAYLVASGPVPPAAAELRGLLRRKLPDYMVPASYVALAALPLTPHGKVDLRALPAPCTEAAAGKSGDDPLTPLEGLLATLWEQLLGVSGIGRHDDFFARGGHSLLATRLVSRLRAACAVELPVRAVFEEPTLAGLARRLEAGRAAAAGLAAPPLMPARRDGEAPLSFAQQSFWYLARLTEDGALLNVPHAVRLSGPLDVAALAAAFAEIVRRHEVLRTAVVEVAGRPRLALAAAAPVALPVVDLTVLPPGLRSGECGRLCAALARLPVSLDRAPLLRLALLRLGAGEQVLQLTFHHIAADDWSTGVLVRELTVLYPALVRRLAARLPPLPIQYGDFAAWQRGWLRGAALERLLDYWRRRLAGAPELSLPTRGPRRPAAAWRGAHQAMEVPATLAAAVRGLSRQQAVTPFIVLLTTFLALLARTSGQEDLVVAIDVTGRDRLETEGLIGLFVNLLVVRADLGGDPPFTELLRRVRDRVLEAYDHQGLPFDRLVEALRPRRSPDATPFARALFSFQTMRLPERLGELAVEPLELTSGTVKRDLSLFVRDAPEAWAGAFSFNAELFEAATIARLRRDFNALLAGAVAQPGARLRSLALASEQERRAQAAAQRTRSEAALLRILAGAPPPPAAGEGATPGRRRSEP
ncbi:MAG TPA: non-ribosomal peptide synthase/polyketide synthase [Thermoanaerobaculia bacterium]|nr:non-ribosomal peptide synthase/polyketide synthase [Thermoanaerobaculia bacterium]